MTFADYTMKIAQQKDDKLAVWTGPEGKMMEIFLGVLAQTYDLEIKRVDSVQEIMTKIQSKKMLGGKGKLYVVRDDSGVWDAENFVMKMNLMLNKDRLVLIYTNMDKRKKFYKESDAVEFDYLDEDVLVGYIGDELSDKNARRLVQMCERDYSRILLELDKVKKYAESQDITNDESFIKLVKMNMIYAPIGDVLFQMTDAVVGRKRDEAYRLLYQLYQKGEAPIKILSILYTNFRNLLVVQGTDAGAGIAERTGLTPWQCSLASKFKGIWKQSKIKEILRVIQDCESGIKNGKYDDRTAIEVTMIGVLG